MTDFAIRPGIACMYNWLAGLYTESCSRVGNEAAVVHVDAVGLANNTAVHSMRHLHVMTLP